jgi:hypothetical protein
MKNMKTKTDWLIGTWETWDEDSRVVYDINKVTRGLKVRAFDKNDGEEYVVTKTKWDGRSLSFEICVPSTKYRTKNRLTPVSPKKFIQEITFWEPWKKVAKAVADQRIAPRTRKK